MVREAQVSAALLEWRGHMNFIDTEIQDLNRKAERTAAWILNEFEESMPHAIVTLRHLSPSLSEANAILYEVMECAVQTIVAVVRSYIGSCNELAKYPDDEDLIRLAEFTKPFITGLLPRYRHFLLRSAGEDTPAEIIDALTKHVETELEATFDKEWASRWALHLKDPRRPV